MTKGQKRAATKDENRIISLLCGRTVRDERKLPQQRYLEDGSPKELEARRALARYLRTSRPMDFGVRSAIADLLDPDCIENERYIRFGHRRKGQPSRSALAEREIAELIWSHVQAGNSIDTAFRHVEEKFGLKQSSTKTIWKHWQPILRRLKRTTPIRNLSDWYSYN